MKKVSKLMGLILALSLVFTLASVSASASFLDDFKNITNTKLSNITNTKLSDITNVTNTKQEETAAPAQVTPEAPQQAAILPGRGAGCCFYQGSQKDPHRQHR